MKRFVCLVVLTLAGLSWCGYVAAQSDYNLRKAVELMDSGDYAESMKYLERQLEETPENAVAYLFRGQLYLYQEKYGKALSDMSSAIKFYSKSDDLPRYSAYWWRALIYMALEDNDKALDDFDTACRLARKKDLSVLNDILQNRAQLFYDMEDYAAAEADYRLMLENDESDQRAMTGLARNQIAVRDYEKAVEIMDRCEKYDKTYEGTYLYRMKAYAAMGMTDKAIDDVISYYEYSSDPDLSEMKPVLKSHLSYALAKADEMAARGGDRRKWMILKTTIFESGYDYAAAVEVYNAIEKEFGADEIIYFYRSDCYNELGCTEQAVSDITKYMEMHGDADYYPLAMRGDFYREGGEYEKAIEDFTKAASLIPTDAYAYYKRGWCYELMGDDDKAMKDYNTGIDLDQSYPYIYLMRGEMYLKNGDRTRADADFEVVLQKDTVVQIGSARHYALHFLGRDEEALEWMNGIIDGDPDNPSPYYDLSCLLARMGRGDEAVSALKNAFERGYRAFAHIENDDDMDPLRDRPDFKALVERYRDEPLYVIPQTGTEDDAVIVSEIQMKKKYSGVYEVSCDINGLPLRFILDTGASTVSISSVEASFMLKNDYLNESDIKGKDYFSTATGEIREGTVINLKRIRIGDAELRNVEASVAHNQEAPLLLGQSVLERFGTVTIDNINSKLVIRQ